MEGKSGDLAFRTGITLSSALTFLLLVGMFFTLLYFSLPALQRFGPSLIFLTSWDPLSEKFGILPFIIGTLITSILALAISFPFSLSIGLFLAEYYRGTKVSHVIGAATEVLAGIPSVVYGLWGLTFLVPIMRDLAIYLGRTPYGVGIATSVFVLILMIVPFSASLIREVISLVPSDLKEAAYSLGATRYEVVRHVILPYTKTGIIAGTLLSFGRAMGETMAVTMLIGNVNHIPSDLFDPANTMASVIANEFQESSGMTFSSLVFVGLVLFLMTFMINLFGRHVLSRIGISKELDKF